MTYLEMPPGVTVEYRVGPYGWPRCKAKKRHARHRRQILAKRAAKLAKMTGAPR